jgi:hypothetical protein
MIDALVVSNIVLWALVIGLALTVFALTRQIGLLHERISPVGALSPQAKVSLVLPFPDVPGLRHASSDCRARGANRGATRPGGARKRRRTRRAPCVRSR